MKRLLPVVVAVFCLAAGILLGLVLADRLQQPWLDTSGLLFDARPPLDIPSIQDLTASAKTDAEALEAIRVYADGHDVRAVFAEPNEIRARALFAMYLIHLSHPYNVETYQAPTLLDFIRVQQWTNCGLNATYQRQIAVALGLTARLGSGFDHSWIEVEVNQHWETFDSTVNVWLSESGRVALHGSMRAYRTFYTPVLDRAHPEARAHLDSQAQYGWYNVILFRQRVIGLGITWRPGGEVTYAP